MLGRRHSLVRGLIVSRTISTRSFAVSAFAVAALAALQTSLASAAPPPPSGTALFSSLAKLPSYHVSSRIVYVVNRVAPVSIIFSEDVHGKDYRLTYSAASGSTATVIYYVGGHLYVGAGGTFVDAGTQGKQEAAPLLASTLGYWTTLVQTTYNTHFLRRVTVDGRLADRYTVQWGVSSPGATGVGGGSTRYANTIDVDVATHALLNATGSYKGAYGGQSYSLTTSWTLTRIGYVGPITVPSH